MDKRFLLAIVLSVLVIFATQRLFPSPPSERGNSSRPAAGAAPVAGAPTTRQAQPAPSGVGAVPISAPAAGTAAGTAAGPVAGATAGNAESAAVAASPSVAGNAPAAPSTDTVSVRTPLVDYAFSTTGAAPIQAELLSYRSTAPGGGQVDLSREGSPVLAYRLAVGGDTIALDRTAFTVDSAATPATQDRPAPLGFRAATPAGEVAVTYTFVPDSYLVRVAGRVSGPAAERGTLLITFPGGLESAEADSTGSQRSLAYVYRPVADDPASIGFGKLDPGERLLQSGPLQWVASKNKYFLTALLTDSAAGQRPFAAATFTGGPRQGKVAVNADATVALPLSSTGTFAFDIYTGPQEWRRLRALGRSLDNANPYGGFASGFVQPFATIVMRTLLWMRETLGLNYGWVLIIFGVVIRLALWPLNQGAMRTSLKMQRLQPEMQEIQRRYKNDPEKQRTAMMRLYKEHNMSPFSMFSGCLPMLLPMPVLFALFFVFQNTIEFRGVSFLWIPDLSLYDPLFILPLVMGLSMFLMSWIGMRGTPPNAQAKMMGYVMPLAMTAIFFKFASGLNLYYAVQNLAALPQQWLIARERSKSAPVPHPAPALRR